MNENGNATLGNRLAAGAHEGSAFNREKFLKFGTPALLTVILLVVFSQSLASPGLLDEKFLLLWLKSLSHLRGDSGLSAFLGWGGFDRADSWGFITKLFIYAISAITFKSLFLLKSVSLLLHAANTFLVYRCTRLLTAGRTAAIISAVLFAVYPLHFESVAWLGGVASELGGLFLLSALGFYIDALKKGLSWKAVALVSV